jgi:hypothetical protein
LGIFRKQWRLWESFVWVSAMHIIAWSRMEGKELLVFVLDLPQSVIALILPFFGWREKPWWWVFLATCPLVGLLMIGLFEYGFLVR